MVSMMGLNEQELPDRKLPLDETCCIWEPSSGNWGFAAWSCHRLLEEYSNYIMITLLAMRITIGLISSNDIRIIIIYTIIVIIIWHLCHHYFNIRAFFKPNNSIILRFFQLCDITKLIPKIEVGIHSPQCLTHNVLCTSHNIKITTFCSKCIYSASIFVEYTNSDCLVWLLLLKFDNVQLLYIGHG